MNSRARLYETLFKAISKVADDSERAHAIAALNDMHARLVHAEDSFDDQSDEIDALRKRCA